MINAYYRLTKPGIIRGNVMTAAAGFLFASGRHIDLWLLLVALAGVALVIGSACVINNYIDRDIDKKMERTKNRALVTGTISPIQAFVFAGLLGLGGFALLVWQTNALTVWLGVIAFVSYVVLYGIAKRRGPYGTLVGSIPGAMSITAGYTAVSGRFDRGALLIFLVMVAWQMPHFYAIATYRLKEYKAAGLPVLPAVKGIKRTKKSMLLFMLLFAAAIIALFVFDYTGWTYLVVMGTVAGLWLRLGLQGFGAKDDVKWAKKVFGFSLLTLLIFSLMISLEAWLP
jgi:protoheme IX farnesyltransferase